MELYPRSIGESRALFYAGNIAPLSWVRVLRLSTYRVVKLSCRICDMEGDRLLASVKRPLPFKTGAASRCIADVVVFSAASEAINLVFDDVETDDAFEDDGVRVGLIGAGRGRQGPLTEAD